MKVTKDISVTLNLLLFTFSVNKSAGVASAATGKKQQTFIFLSEPSTSYNVSFYIIILLKVI
jgi:hypothetical protein